MSQSQRVNIQYSIDLSELPTEVKRLVGKLNEELKTSEVMGSDLAASDAISVSGLEQINNLRVSLAKADHILDDVTKIVSGYMQMTTQQQTAEQPEQEAPPVNPFTPNADTLNSLEEKLRTFTDRMSNEQSAEIANNEQ
jgi:hypothetical protein